VAETPEQLFERASSRLRMPPVEEWDTFPFDGDLQPRELRPPEQTERGRRGEDVADCWRCQEGDAVAIWTDEEWIVTPLAEPSGLPVVVLLFPREHVDIDGLSPELAAALGPMLLRVEAAVRSVGEVGRVHVCRWGDGSFHLHWWFMARPARLPQLIGTFAAIWDDVLPPTPEAVWRENLAHVARTLAVGGGTAHV